MSEINTAEHMGDGSRQEVHLYFDETGNQIAHRPIERKAWAASGMVVS